MNPGALRAGILFWYSSGIMKKILTVLGLFAGIVVLVSVGTYLFPDPERVLNCVESVSYTHLLSPIRMP